MTSLKCDDKDEDAPRLKCDDKDETHIALQQEKRQRKSADHKTNLSTHLSDTEALGLQLIRSKTPKGWYLLKR